ncbi:MAG: mechanosensitive ion channel family protein, partial [Hungatella sp.]
LEIKVGIGYQSDLKKAKDLLRILFEEHPLICTEDPIVTFVDELASDSVMLGVRGWVATTDYWTAKWELTESIKLTFDQEGIEIPYAQLDVHMHSER